MINGLPFPVALPATDTPTARQGRRDNGAADFGDWLAERPVADEGDAKTYPRPGDGRIPQEELLLAHDQLGRDIAISAAHGIASRPQDVLDFSLLPWRLCANLGLSYAGKAPPPGAGPYAMGATSATGSQQAAATTLGTAAIFAPAGTAVGGGIADPLVSIGATVAREAQAVARADAVRAPDAGRLSHLLWPQRLVRSQSGEDGLTVWVRDYRLDTNDAHQLLLAIRCDAERQGLPLHRIVLNGHELWRAPSQS